MKAILSTLMGLIIKEPTTFSYGVVERIDYSDQDPEDYVIWDPDHATEEEIWPDEDDE